MDSVELPEPELEQALGFLAGLNRRLGGHRVVLSRLDEWTRGWAAGREVSVLDVGAGAGDHLAAMDGWARRRGLRLRAVGIDSEPAVARSARRRLAGLRSVRIVEESLERHAASGARYDFVCASLMLHHVPEEGLVPALQALDSLAGRGVVVNDLRRCRAGYWSARLLTAFFGNRVVRHDGPLSVRRAFTLRELGALAARAGLPYLRPRRHWGFRLSLSGVKTRG